MYFLILAHNLILLKNNEYEGIDQVHNMCIIDQA